MYTTLYTNMCGWHVYYTCYYRCKVTCILYIFLGESLIKLINSCSTTPNDAPLFEIQTTPRNELFWYTTSVESIMRPVCFIPTINTFSYYNRGATLHNPITFTILSYISLVLIFSIAIDLIGIADLMKKTEHNVCRLNCTIA